MNDFDKIPAAVSGDNDENLRCILVDRNHFRADTSKHCAMFDTIPPVVLEEMR